MLYWKFVFDISTNYNSIINLSNKMLESSYVYCYLNANPIRSGVLRKLPIRGGGVGLKSKNAISHQKCRNRREKIILFRKKIFGALYKAI